MSMRAVSSLYREILSHAPRLAQSVFELDGRINRARYWLHLALAVPVLALLGEAYLASAGLHDDTVYFAVAALAVLAQFLAALAIVAILLAAVAVTVRRLHDRDKPGSWIAHFVVAPALLFWLGQQFLDAHLERVHSLPFLLQFVALFVSVWSFVELCCRRGTAGPNRFGSDPLQPAIDTANYLSKPPTP